MGQTNRPYQDPASTNSLETSKHKLQNLKMFLNQKPGDNIIDRILGEVSSMNLKFANGAATAAMVHLLNHENIFGRLSGKDALASVYANKVGNAEGGFDTIGVAYSPTDGFAARLTEIDGHYYIAFRGTSDFDDWLNNAQQGTGFASSQYDQAVRLATDVAGKLPSGSYTFVGHSLGGGLASAAAHATGGPAITFNAAGLHSRYMGPHSPSIRAHYIRGDILSFAQRNPALPSAAGTRISHPPRSIFQNRISRHSMSNF